MSNKAHRFNAHGDRDYLRSCGLCDEPILEAQAVTIYDGEKCHIDCVAESEDEAGFDNWFSSRN